MKNTLAAVQSLARQTARQRDSVGGFVGTLEARLVGLAHVHDLLARRHWEGAGLQALIGEIVAPFAESGRIRLAGPELDLEPRTATAFAMALTELATNASKYGALSDPSGTLSITWAMRPEPSGRVLDLDWLERGGPRVAPPPRCGFGTRLMERCIEADPSGHIGLRFDPEGVMCHIALPLPDCVATVAAGNG